MRSHIQFYPTNWEWRDARQVVKRLVEGVGNNDADYAIGIRVNGKQLRCPAYVSWNSMLERCYSEKCHQKQPYYVGTTCVKTWLRFLNFRKWYFQQRDLIAQHGYEGPLQLDKDILVNSKIYGPEACLLVTPALNALLVDSRASRGKYPIGVSKAHDKFQARVCVNGKRKHKYGFNLPEEAAEWRLKTKLEHVMNYPLPPWLDESIVRPRLIEIVRNQK